MLFGGLISRGVFLENCLEPNHFIAVHAAITENNIIAAVSSIPRWRFARSIEAKEEIGVTRNLDKAIVDFMDSSRVIISGKNNLCNFPVGRKPGKCALYIQIYAALARTALYLG